MPTADLQRAEMWPPFMVRTVVEATADTEPLRQTAIDLTKIGPAITEPITTPIIEAILQETIQEAIRDHLLLPQGHILRVPEVVHQVTVAVPQG